eukprot:TRINITY_DN72597_c0_g1_i1.p1 TRINITY_DN72597_c0_g1~~TRINITY_DN72597_c0_g1_i1.p1  ORF type:complete len:264 (+),score=75.68 TRINITY_DN72597_c0_g1_i1:62-853(+)
MDYTAQAQMLPAIHVGPAQLPTSHDAAIAALAKELSGKPYHQFIEDVIKHTAACRGDFDQKTFLIFDELHKRGRAEAACEHLKDVLRAVLRSHVEHWRGYIWKLLRDFDDDAYHAVKAKLAHEYAEHLPWIESPRREDHLRKAAPVFAPGHLGWVGELSPDDFAAVAAHPLHADAPALVPGQVIWAGETAPPPPPPVAEETREKEAVDAAVEEETKEEKQQKNLEPEAGPTLLTAKKEEEVVQGKVASVTESTPAAVVNLGEQ